MESLVTTVIVCNHMAVLCLEIDDRNAVGEHQPDASITDGEVRDAPGGTMLSGMMMALRLAQHSMMTG